MSQHTASQQTTSGVTASAPGAPLGPGSLLWRIAADWRSGLSGLSAGLLQLMYPHLGRGVEEHSAFFDEPWDRIHRSVPQIWATIFADDADERGLTIRDYHRDIKGTDDHGERYHALDPDTFWWAHATFTWEMFETADRWDHRSLSCRHREQLYQETVTWYRRYGVSDRPVPPDHASFARRFEEICRDELELTPTAERALDMALHERFGPPGMPGAMSAVMTPVMRTITLGALPPIVRERFDIPWTAADEVALRGIELTVRNAGTVVPHRLTRGPYLRSIKRMKHQAAPPTGGLTVPKEATRVDVVDVLSRLATEPVGDETDDRILRAAGMMLLGEGLSGFEVDDVASRSGVGRSTLYRRFGDRNTLIAAALAHEGRRFFTALADAVAADDDIVEQVVAAFCAGLRLARAGGLADLLRSDPLLLRALTVDGGVIVAAARDQLVALAGGRHPGVDVGDVERNAEVLVRLGISFVLTPASVLDLEGAGCEHAVRQIVAPLLTGR